VASLSQHIIFKKNIVLRTWRTTQYFFVKIMCCGRKNKVADTCHHTFATFSYTNCPVRARSVSRHLFTAHIVTDHQCDSVAAKTVRQQFGEFAVAVRYVTLTLLRVTQRRYAVTWPPTRKQFHFVVRIINTPFTRYKRVSQPV